MAQDFIFCYGEPGDSTWTVVASSGTGTQFDSDPTELSDGRPANQTPIVWPTVAQTTAINIQVRREWTSGAIVPKTITILGLSNIPPGTKMVVTGRRAGDTVGTYPYALGGNSNPGRTVTLDDGSVALVVVCDDGLTAIVGFQVAIYNATNQTGSDLTYRASGEFVYVGNIGVFQGYYPPQGVEYDWVFDFEGMPVVEPTSNNQSSIAPNRPYRTCAVTLEAADFTAAFGALASPGAVTYMSMAWTIARGGQCGAIVRHLDSSGNLDLFAIHHLSIFGTAPDSKPPKPMGGNYFKWDVKFIESAPGN
jgi:hypothetical protein